MAAKFSAVASRRTGHICLYINLLLLQSFIAPCQLAIHYCVNGHTMSIWMGDLYHKDETIIPDIPDEPIDKRGSYRRCSWEITVAEVGNQNAPIVLEGVNLENEDVSGSSNKTQVNISLNGSENVTLGMFHVMPLSQRNHISVQINWDPKTQRRSPVNLRILIPVAGLCSRDMLSFNGSCHAISTVPADMKAVEHCSGDARLASFTSMAHINEFIAANDARQDELPYRSPLDLSKWVRLGMFYIAGDDVILSVVRTKSGFELKKVDKHLVAVSQLNVSGACGSLRVNELGKAELQFEDCNKPMLTLMSFSEIAKPPPDNSLNSSKDLLHEITLLVSKSTKVFASTSRFSATTENHENPHSKATESGFTFSGNINSKLILVYCLPGIVLVGILTAVIKFILRRKSSKSDEASKSKKRVQTGSRQVATLAKPEVKGQQMTGSMQDLEAKKALECGSGSPLLTHANPVFNC